MSLKFSKLRMKSCSYFSLFLIVPFVLAGCSHTSPMQKKQLSISPSIEQRAYNAFSNLVYGGVRSEAMPIGVDMDSVIENEDKAKLYLANFPNKGFILFQEDSLLTMEVLAYSDESSLHYSDTLDNVSLKEYIIKPVLRNFLDNSLSKDLECVGPDGNPIPPKPLPNPSLPKFEYPKYEYNDKVNYVDYFCRPSTFGYFDQEYPFYEKIGDRWSIGCGGVAVGTLLSYYKVKDPDNSIDWDILFSQYQNEYAVDSIMKVKHPSLLKNLQNWFLKLHNYTRVWRGEKNKHKYTMSIAPTLKKAIRKYGLDVSSFDYDQAFLLDHFKNGDKSPLIIRGWDGPYSAHYWVIDASAIQNITFYTIRYTSKEDKGDRINERTENRLFYHCVWGWKGYCNGWYSPKVFYAGRFFSQNLEGKSLFTRKSGTPNQENHFMPTLIFKTSRK